MSEAEQLLAMLADVHEPPVPEAAWPWLWMLNGLLVTAWIGLRAWRRHRQRTALRREAITALDALSGDEPAARLANMATLLRRVVRERLGESVAGLDGDAWLAVLDGFFGTRWFTQGEGQVFGHTLYRRDTPASTEVAAVQAVVRSWLRSLPPATRDGVPGR